MSNFRDIKDRKNKNQERASSKGALKIELSLEVRAEIFSSPPGNEKANDNVMSSS